METYKLISVKEFPRMKINETKKTIIDGALPGFNPDPKTEIRLINPSYYGFEYYEFKHQMLFHENGIAFGFINENPQTMQFTNYLKEFTVKCFLNRTRNYAFLTSASYVISDLMKTCKKNDDLKLEFLEISLDMQDLFLYTDDFLGTWFRGVSPRVSSSALFGSDLVNEPLYLQLTNDGATLTSVTIPYNDLKIQLNEKAGISTKHIFDNINDELNLVERLRKDIIDKIKVAE
jgi:hypothetical protein